MATIKAAVRSGKLKSIINYVLQEEKIKSNLVTGKDCSADNTLDEMITTKKIYGKLGGREYKHFTQNFHKDEKITSKQAHDIAVKFANECKLFNGFEVLIATHEDREHIHSHFIVNSVNLNDGHKFQMKKRDLQVMKDLSDELCRSQGLSICEKGKTFEQSEVEETVAYSKEVYSVLRKAEQGGIQSYIQDIAIAVLKNKEKAKNKAEFIEKMKKDGYRVEWTEKRKHILFVDEEREKNGEKKCKVRNSKLEQYYHIPLGKEILENEFEENLRRTKRREQARRELDTGTYAEASGREGREAKDFIEQLNARERITEQEREDKLSQRANREACRERQRAEAKQRAEIAKQEAERRERERTERSRSRGLER